MTSGGTARRTVQLLSAMVAAACALAVLVAIARATDPNATQSLGIHFESTGFASVMARADGGLVTLRGLRIESFRADGTPDPATPTLEAPAEGALFPAAGGKTFVLGYKTLTRLEPDGSVDRSFGGTGTIEPGYGARAVKELGSGKIAVVSTETGGTHTIFSSVSVELLNQDGTVVKGGGFSSPVTPASYGIGVSEISPTSDGGALVIGTNFLLELNADGILNRGFGDEGLVSGVFSLIGGHVLADGSVEAVGTAYEEGPAGSEDLALYRYTSSGQPDSTFGPKGLRRFDLNGNQDAAKVASWGADGSVIVGGRTQLRGPCPKECEEVPILVAFTAAGELEAGFAQGGVLRLASLAAKPDGYRSLGVAAMARRPDGSIVAVGNAPPNETVAFLAAVSPQGALLPGFGEGGVVRVREPLRASQQVAGLVPMPDGKLLAAGTTDVGIEDQPVLIRYDPDGSLDRSFGAGAGYVILRRSQGGSSHGATGFAVQGDNVLTGVYDYPLSHLLMVRAGDGSPRPSFGSDGSIDLPREVRVATLAFARDGDPLVLGIQRVAGPTSGEPGVILRYRPDGRPDETFGRGGRFTMELGGRAVRGKALVPGPGERILVGGSIGHRFAMTSLLLSGRPDPRFGSGGWSITKLGAATHFVALARIGSHIYLAGTVGEEFDRRRLILMRFERDGRLDRSFGRRGRLAASLTSEDHPTKILPTRNGVLVVLSGGPQPLLTFTRDGKVRRRPVGAQPQFVGNVRAAVSGDRLILGWTTYSGTEKAVIYHLARRSLERP
ncbi:MAG TPA: hypothetical protein VEW07_04820 [Solirubrobacterales bacterium]|nr:hypothetical protein [Solirubrobacterales bacterium]